MDNEFVALESDNAYVYRAVAKLAAWLFLGID